MNKLERYGLGLLLLVSSDVLIRTMPKSLLTVSDYLSAAMAIGAVVMGVVITTRATYGK